MPGKCSAAAAIWVIVTVTTLLKSLLPSLLAGQLLLSLGHLVRLSLFGRFSASLLGAPAPIPLTWVPAGSASPREPGQQAVVLWPGSGSLGFALAAACWAAVPSHAPLAALCAHLSPTMQAGTGGRLRWHLCLASLWHQWRCAQFGAQALPSTPLCEQASALP